MLKISDFLIVDLWHFGGWWWLSGIFTIFGAYYLLHWRTDAQTAVEMTCIAWLMIFLNVALGIMDSFGTIGSPNWMRIQLDQYLIFVSNLLVPTLLTLPIAWTCLGSESGFSLSRSRLLIMAVSIAVADLLFYFSLILPLFGWHLKPPEM